SAAFDGLELNPQRFGLLDSNSVGPYAAARAASAAPANVVRHNIWLESHQPAYGADTKTRCNSDADCADGTTCDIRVQTVDATHRGRCAPTGFDHQKSDGACVTDSDCLPYGSSAISATAACDVATNTCGERYVRCGQNSDCTSIDALSTCD